ncbi:uncharacterized protein LOC132751922 isoform X3 [Ruditapes philippinarum]|uniref:uncharacterized protein LOC132751922 isoform X3 n=1 Tax=Ruditapes philippinarum TaxID=129788 RepID=UPI00295A90C5|nr:uncharacterized protein LOC132751922 isoform X3 [Ruditapes philippinarum]
MTMAPTREEKDRLYKANLGEKKISFEKNDDAGYFKCRIEEHYPKLDGIGGFELLRTQARSRCDLEVIIVPPGGYTVNFLSNFSNLGQAVCYIRPIQNDLSLVDQEFSDEDGVQEECIHCHEMIPLRLLREHTNTCEVSKKDKDLDLQSCTLPPTRKELIQTPVCQYACNASKSADCPVSQDPPAFETCPVCYIDLPVCQIQEHADTCCSKQESDPGVVPSVENKSYEEALHNVYEAFSEQWELSIVRRHFLLTAMEQIEDATKDDWVKKVKVRFIGEEGIDEGGLTREFFTLLFKHTPIFDSDMIHVSADLLSKDVYLKMGKMTGMALLTGHPGPRCFTPHLVDYIICEKTPNIISLPEELIKADVKHAIQQIGNISEGDEDAVNLQFSDLLDAISFQRRITVQNKTEVINALKRHHLFYRCLPGLLQYMEGLKNNGVLDILRRFPDAKECFLKTELSSSEIMDLFVPSFSTDDIQKSDEEIVVYNFHQFLKNVERGRVVTNYFDLDEEVEHSLTVKLSDVLQSLIGCKHVAPNMKGSITFDHSSKSLSTVNTCSPSINFSNIKDIITYRHFEQLFISVVFGTYGFGMV